MKPSRHAASGFTLVELVMTLVVVAALAAFALPRVLDLGALRLRAYADELAAQTLAMQRLALAQRRAVVATIEPTGVSFAYAAGGTLLSLPCPAAVSPCIAETGTRTATFNAGNSGSTTTSSGAALPITLTGSDLTLPRQIEAQTGLFRTLP
jgi:prepilin-type N-terminal cleavage/methylation domain-containing protein